MWFRKKKKYKFNSLKTYSWDRTINNTRRYRKVFDKSEITYLSVGLEFYNLLFAEKDWTAKITLIAYTVDGDQKLEEHCNHTKEHVISKEKNSVIIDYGWGNDDRGSYWKKGNYIWEAYIDDEFIASTKFHIEDVGTVTFNENPFFNVTSLKTLDVLDEKDDSQTLNLKHFLHENTFYITSEIELQNKVPHKWLCELFFNYYDDSGLLIGSSQEIGFINSRNTQDPDYFITIRSQWGSSNPGAWLKDNYRVEVIFMDTVVALIPFSVADELLFRENDNEALLNDQVANIYLKSNISTKSDSESEDSLLNYDYVADESESPTISNDSEPVLVTPSEDDSNEKTFNELIAELNALIGLDNVKQKVKEYTDYILYLQMRAEKGLTEDKPINLHSVFTGNPGTGKTTVVELLGQIYKSIGLLSKGQVITVNANDLISGYVRQTGEATQKYIDKARGGILFIDEAYMLYKKDATNDFGTEAVTTLMTEMSDGEGDIAIMVAGYPKEMEDFINSNPGLKSRFVNKFHFNDYTPNELLAIALYAANKKEVRISEKAIVKLKKVITEAYRKRDNTFGNARFVHSIIDEAKMDLGIRLIRDAQEGKEYTKDELITIEECDIETAISNETKPNIQLVTDQELLNEALNELNSLIGLKEVKKEVNDLTRLTRYYKETNRNILKALSLHSIFMGNPGTGKTTVARIIGKVYKALGLLERGHVVEADGSSLIAGYVGQSALKTKELIKKAMGGILFIDEAYSITEGSMNGKNDFGKKAIAALLKEMEDHRGEFCVVVAGYPDNMNEFIETNPGLKSRFDRTYHFEDFSKGELWEIMLSMLSSKGLTPDKKAEQHLKNYIDYLHKTRNKFFGNARSMRKITERAVRNQELRMAHFSKEERTNEMIQTLSYEDVKEFSTEQKEQISTRTKIGYKI